MFIILRRDKSAKMATLVFFAACIFLSIFLSTAKAESSSPTGDQWASVGGSIVASGKHEFKNKWWAAHRYADGGGKFWKTTKPMLLPDVKLATYNFDDVKKDVLVPKGQISVKGPGFLARFVKGDVGNAGAGTKFPSGKDFFPASLGRMERQTGSDGKESWFENNIVEFHPDKVNSGWVPDGKTLTLDVFVYSEPSDWGIWGRGYNAPKEVEYEYWYFPREGGEIVKVSDINTAHEDTGYTHLKKGKVFDQTTGKWLSPGEPVPYEHQLATGPDGGAYFEGPDGSIFAMRKNSIISVNNPSAKQKSKRSSISMAAGRLWSLFAGQKGTYKIETFNSVVAVEGTSFETAYDVASETTTVMVFEGVVKLSCKIGDLESVLVNADQIATMDGQCVHRLSKLDPSANTPAKAGWSGVKTSALLELSPVADSHVYAFTYLNWNKSNWGAFQNLGAGWHPQGGEKRTYLKFDLTDLTLDDNGKATLKLFHYHTGGSNAVALGVHQVTSPWEEGVGTYKPATIAGSGEITWINQPSFNPTPEMGFNPGKDTNNWIELDVTPLVKNWLADEPNYGLVIKSQGSMQSKPESQYSFRSREFKESDKRPVLVLSGGE